MLYQVTISKKGQISISAAIRRQVGLMPGPNVGQPIVNVKLVLNFDL